MQWKKIHTCKQCGEYFYSINDKRKYCFLCADKINHGSKESYWEKLLKKYDDEETYNNLDQDTLPH